jgi:transcriptional regulator with XRE-family HTH domain
VDKGGLMSPEEIVKARQIIFASQRELAKMLSVSPQLVGNWEMGRSKPKPDKISEIKRLMEESIARIGAAKATTIQPSGAPAELTLTPLIGELIASANHVLNVLDLTQPVEGPLGDAALVLTNSLGRVLDALKPEDRQRVVGLSRGADRKLRLIERSIAERRVRQD